VKTESLKIRVVRKSVVLGVVSVLALPLATAALFAGSMPEILPLRTRARIMDQWLEHRLDHVVPALMRRENIDMWVLIAEEYNDDPVMRTMLPATWFTARRRTILVFFDPGDSGKFERLAVSRYSVGRFFKTAWKKEEQPDQWACLRDIIAARSPDKIAISQSSVFSQADGLSATSYEAFLRSLPAGFEPKIVSGERLAVGWLETRTSEEMDAYPQLCRIAHRIIEEGLSEKSLTPGITTTADLEWWFRERVAELRLSTWFHPTVSVQRAAEASERSFSEHPDAVVIEPGDLVHVDFGITYLGLNTDTQQHAYVLKWGETDAPQGLREGLRLGNRLQDILMAQFATGKTGNDLLKAALARADNEGIRASIYSHPLGYHGHAAGPTIGLWDQQDGVPGAGDYPVYPSTAYSIELNVTVSVPEWGNRDVRIMLEEDAFFDGSTADFIDGRQTALWLIPRPSTVQ
jgi:Xaa-Pro aminopeptidase